MSDDKQRLQEHVDSIADDLAKLVQGELESCEDEGEVMGAFEYFSDVLDITWILNNSKEYRSCKLLVAFGGPNIWINTESGKIEGAWWGDYAEALLSDSIIEFIDSAMEELFNC